MEEKFLNSKKFLIISLLKAEMKNTKLISGLESAGLSSEDFYLGISTEVLKLIGFEDAENDDELHDFYFKILESSCSKELSEFTENLDMLVLEFYNELLLERIRRQKLQIEVVES